MQCLGEHRRYYALLFSHDFARTFWKPGSELTFQIEAQTFQRRMPDGSVATVNRKPFIRRSARRDAWRFHLREMALAEEPLRYIRRYLHVQEAPGESAPGKPPSDPQQHASSATGNATPHTVPTSTTRSTSPRRTTLPRPLPTEPPVFLTRPYGGRLPNSGAS